MKVLSGISVLALLMAGAATPSFATSLGTGRDGNSDRCHRQLLF